MAAEDRLQPNDNLSSKNVLRRSEPTQHTQQWDPTSLTSLETRVRSMYDVITLLHHVENEKQKQESPSTESPLSAIDTLYEKTGTQVTKIELPNDASSLASSDHSSEPQSHPWSPTYLRISPLIGLVALVLAVLQIFASYAVLQVSQGRPVVDWRFGPSVYIAVLTALSNGAISFAAVKGAVVSFWLRSLGGSTLGQLHRDWAYSFEAYYALRSGRNVNLLALACIFATLVCIDGPLLQRAASTQTVNYHKPVNLDVKVVPEIPSYFSGTYNADELGAQFSNPILPVINDYSSHKPIIGGIQGCNGSCTATIRAPALAVDHCESNTTWHNFSEPYTQAEMEVYNRGSFPTQRWLFATYLSSSYGTSETLDFQTYLTGNQVADTCAGTINSTHCYLRSAIAEYDVSVANETITLKDPGNPRFISWANNTAITNETISKFDLRVPGSPGWIKTTLGAIVNAFLFEYSFTGFAYPPGHSKHGVLDISVESQSLFMYQLINNYAQYNNQTACTYTWNDPRPATMAGLNELMFRIGVHAAQSYENDYLEPLLDPGVETNYTVTGTLHGPQEVFKSDFAYFFAAAALELLTILLVASTFFGYWKLGRHVSFSPLEIAKAFDAPLLKYVPCNATGRQIAKAKDAESVRYGVSYSQATGGEMEQGMGTLKMAEPSEVVELIAGRLEDHA